MKEEYNKIPRCFKCNSLLDYNIVSEISYYLYYNTDGDYYKYENSKNEYMCKSCKRDSKIKEIIS